MTRSAYWLLGLGLFSALTLAGCGGGGGGDGGGGSGGGSSGQLTLSTNALTFTSTPDVIYNPRQSVSATISGVSVSTLYLSIQISGNAILNVQNIQVTSSNAGTADVVAVAPVNLGPGSFTGTVTVTACSSSPSCTSGIIGTPQTINVVYNINGVRTSDSHIFYTAADTLANSVFSRPFTVTGFPSQNWTATSSVPWLTVTPLNGNAGTSTTVTAAAVPAQVDLLPNGTFTGSITLTPATGTPVTMTATLNVNRTRVNYVAPYVAYSGVAGSVIVRGENFTRYPTTGVRFGSNNATSFTVVSDTEIRADYPALIAGNYPVHLVNAQGIDITRAALVVIDLPTYTAATLTYPTSGRAFVTCLKHDAERRALIAEITFDKSPAPLEYRLLRFKMDSGWAVTENISLPAPGTCTLTTDGTKLLVGRTESASSSAFLVAEHDPATLVQSSTSRNPRAILINSSGSAATSNNGRAFFATTTGLQSYTPLVPGLYDVLWPGVNPPSDLPGGPMASTDGSTVLALGQLTWRFDSNTNQFVQASANMFVGASAMNRDGSRLLTNNSNTTSIYNANLQLLGTLPSAAIRATLSPSLSRAYVYESNPSDPYEGNGTVRTFDISTQVNGSFPEIGTAISITGHPGLVVEWTPTLDGRAIFIAGLEQIVLVPLQ